MATELRARHGLRVPDALHLACAIVNRCDRFLTNDHRLDRIQEVRHCLVHRFPYGVLYSVESEGIFILAVMHLRRDPDYWRFRR
jgi:hypothetical protein